MKWPLLIFDLDGTLIDSAQDIATALNRTLKQYGKQTVPYETVVEHIGEGLFNLLVDFFPEFQNQPPASYQHVYENFLQTYEEEMFKTTRPFPGVFEFLRSYEGPVGIITNKRKDPASKIIRHLGLSTVPWVGIFGGDTWPEKKPDPMPFVEMMKRAGRSPAQTIMIGDGTPDMQGAINAGLRSIAVDFGYTKLEILKRYEPVAVLSDYKDLQNVIVNLLHH